MNLLQAIRVLVPGATQEQMDFFLLPIIEKAQACLDNYTEEEQSQALAYLFAHLFQLSQGGQITSERTRTGAQRSFKQTTGTGLAATNFGQILLGMSGAADCLKAIVEQPQRFAVSVGRSYK